MRWVYLGIALAAVSSAGFAPVPPVKASKTPPKVDIAKKLEGTWVVEAYERGGGLGKLAILYPKVRITNGRWSQVRALNGKETVSFNYPLTIDASKTPGWFDFRTSDAATTMYRLGLFKLDGDQLVVTYIMGGKDRPTNVDGALEARQYRWVLRREK